jgi:transcriptional regulator with GAF, ATPase, and Fis domain
LDEVIEEIAAGLGRYVIFERLLILELDQEQARLKSAAQFGMTPAVPGHGLDPLPPFAPLRRWCLGDDLVQGRAEEVRQRSPGLVPASWTGDLLAVGLASAGEPLGALLLGTDAVGGLGSPQASRVLALREPIAVALRNHLRLKELTALREAAEADRRSLLARLGRQEITDTLIGGGSGLREVMRGVELVAPRDGPGPDSRGDGFGQGGHCPGHSCPLVPGPGALPPGQLRRHTARPGGLGTLRPRARQLHRCR